MGYNPQALNNGSRIGKRIDSMEMLLQRQLVCSSPLNQMMGV